jgi:hypothetical protein
MPIIVPSIVSEGSWVPEAKVSERAVAQSGSQSCDLTFDISAFVCFIFYAKEHPHTGRFYTN